MKKKPEMKIFDFSLMFEMPNDDFDPDELVKKLQNIGCHDATITVEENSRIYINFMRNHTEGLLAIGSAFGDVHKAIPEAKSVSGMMIVRNYK
ncbi:MAG: hypothetical protein ACKVOA_02735 [Methylophilaceae bacterium]